MEESDIQNYILDQANIEIEHNRSWPTKVMAFYIALNFGLAGVLITLKNNCCSFTLPCIWKTVITIAFLILASWVVRVLWKNHKNYLTYRNIQIFNQNNFLKERKEEFELPEDWFRSLEVCASTRFLGWGLYVYIVVMTTTLVLVGMWLVT
jgi:hypothetical protein